MRCCVGFGQRAGFALDGLHLVDRGAGRVQLPRGQRLLGGVEEGVDAVSRGTRLLARHLRLREAALLDHHDRRLEAPRQRRRADRAVERLPPLGQLGVVDRGVGGEALGLDDQRLGARQRLQFLLPGIQARLRAVQPGWGGLVRARLRLLPQRLQLGAQVLQGFRPVGGGQGRDPFAHAALEPRPRGLLGLLAVEARLQRAARGIAALQACRVVAHVQHLPAAVQVHDRREDRARRAGQRLELREDRVGLGLLPLAVLHRLEPLLRQPRHAAVLVLRLVEERLEALGGVHALGRGQARLRVPAGERELDEQRLVAKPRDGREPAVGVRRLPGHGGADGVVAGGRLQEGARREGIRRFGHHAGQARRERLADAGIGFLVPGGGERGEVRAARGRGGADFRRRVGGDEGGELGGFRRERRHAQDALGGLGVLVKGGAGEEPGDHGGSGYRCGAGARRKRQPYPNDNPSGVPAAAGSVSGGI